MKPDNTKSIKILLWNVNGRLEVIQKNSSPIETILPDILFAMETSLGYGALPESEKYGKFGDGDIHELNHGGIVVYVQNSIAGNVFDVTYNECFVSFRLDFAPQFLIVGAYNYTTRRITIF